MAYLFSYLVKSNMNFQKELSELMDEIYHIFKPKNFKGDQSVYQDKTAMDMTLS